MSVDYAQLIDSFSSQAAKLPGVYDLLLRGSGIGTSVTKELIYNWSDLDFSIIVNEINSTIRHEVRKIYRELKKQADIKITITLVSVKDFFSKYHCHGIRPVYYSCMLDKAKSLLRGNMSYAQKDIGFNEFMKNNCFANVSYLMHDLRKRHMECAGNEGEVKDFCKHLVKRAKHLLRNAIFVKTGYVSEDINEKLLMKHFADVDEEMTTKLKDIRKNWSNICSDMLIIESIIDFVLDNLEKVYESIVQFCQPNDF